MKFLKNSLKWWNNTHITHIKHHIRQQSVNIVNISCESIQNSTARIIIEENHLGTRNTSEDHVMQIDWYTQTHGIKGKWTTEVAHCSKSDNTRVHNDVIIARFFRGFRIVRCKCFGQLFGCFRNSLFPIDPTLCNWYTNILICFSFNELFVCSD